MTLELRGAARLALLLIPITTSVFAADWNKRLAADYLDARAKAWSEWSTAQVPGGTCVSCHTNLTYLIARPALAAALGETHRAKSETDLIDGLRTRLHGENPHGMFPGYVKEPHSTEAIGVNAIITALCLVREDAGKPELSADSKLALDRMWQLQLTEGEARGGWPWFALELDPWEMPDSAFYGASLAALAVGSAPPAYRKQPDVRRHITALTTYLERTAASQPLHNRLALLWASSKLPEAMPPALKQALLNEVRQKQQQDGSWTIESLGAFSPHAAAAPSTGNRAYATSWVAWTLEQGGVSAKDPQLSRALTWLTANQNATTGHWDGQSMNKVYPPDSMQTHFVSDAATAYAALALLPVAGK